MSQKPNVDSDHKSEADRLCQDNETNASKYSDLIASSSKQTHHHHHHHHHNYMNSEIPKEETKSHKIRNSNFHSLSQHSQVNSNQEMQSNNNNSNSNNNTNLNQRYSQNMTSSATSPLLYQYPPFQQAALSSKSTLRSENLSRHPAKQRASTSSSSSMNNNMIGCFQSSSREEYKSAHNSRQDQQDRETNEVVAMIREELEDGPDGFKESELETLGSLERNLPVELSFLIRQQAYCMARMNYLDRQVRELKEVRQTNVPPKQADSTHNINQSHRNNIMNTATSTAANNTTTTTTTHTKNGNFIPSDDSGGEYSRATISDDDELSSLLDQIAKSVRPERNVNPNVRTNHPRTNYNVTGNQPQPQYAIINPGQLHQQAVPVFVMSSPITLAHPSSISSNVLPGVHFQPEARYNQYYEEFYAPNNSSTLHRPNGIRLQQFDNSISAIEQLVSQKEKRQITSQLKTADNWLKMRSSGLCNLNSNYSNTNIRTTNGDGTGSVNDRNPTASSAPDNSNSVIEENRGR